MDNKDYGRIRAITCCDAVMVRCNEGVMDFIVDDLLLSYESGRDFYLQVHGALCGPSATTFIASLVLSLYPY